MTGKHMYKTLRSFTTLAVAVLMALLLGTPWALAAETSDRGTNAIEISEEGTVTLYSANLAAEKVSSLQLELQIESGTTEFEFDGGLSGRLTYCAHNGSSLRIFIAGSEPLLPEGQTALVLGKITDSTAKVTPVEGSLQFVHGTKTFVQTIDNQGSPEPTPPPTPDPERTPPNTGSNSSDSAAEPTAQPEETPKDRLQAVLDMAAEQYSSGTTRYTQESWGALLTAVERANAILMRDDAAPEELEDALAQLENAIRGLIPIGRAALQETLLSSKAYDPAGYTQDSYSALQAAIENAETVLADPTADEAAWTAALAQLQDAIDRLVPVADPDSNGDPIPDGPDDGGSGRSNSSSTPAPTVVPAAGGTGNNTSTPHTGDETVIFPWIMLMIVSGTALVLLSRRRNKNR